MPDINENKHTHPYDHDYNHDHDHEHSHDHDHAHGHEHPHGHSHTHTHTETKAVLNRLSRAIGHLESVRRMVEDGRDCAEVLMQLAAVRSALGNTAKIILKDHIEHCLVEAVRDNDRESIDELNKAIEQFLK
jgi:DNA-binding FrmR family transcriptional regulator